MSAGHRHAGGVEERLGEIEVRDDVAVHAARLDHARPADDQRRAQRLLEDPPLVEPAVLAEVEALVGRVDHDRVLGQPGFVEVLQQPADALVDRRRCSAGSRACSAGTSSGPGPCPAGSPCGTPRSAARSTAFHAFALLAASGFALGGTQLQVAVGVMSWRWSCPARARPCRGRRSRRTASRGSGMVAIVVHAAGAQAPAPSRGAGPCAGTSAGTASTCRGFFSQSSDRSVMMSVM